MSRGTAAEARQLPRVDLRPPAEIERRSALAHARGWALGALAAVATAAVIGAGAAVFAGFEGARLAAEREREQRLLAQVVELRPVSDALASRSQLTSLASAALEGDLAWRPVLTRWQRALPAGTAITSVTLDAGPVPGDGEPTEQTGLTGTIVLGAPTADAVVAASRALRALDEVRRAEVTLVSTTHDEMTVSIELDLDQTIYTSDEEDADADD